MLGLPCTLSSALAHIPFSHSSETSSDIYATLPSFISLQIKTLSLLASHDFASLSHLHPNFVFSFSGTLSMHLSLAPQSVFFIHVLDLQMKNAPLSSHFASPSVHLSTHSKVEWSQTLPSLLQSLPSFQVLLSHV